ncbi:MAG: ABC transporter permease, partial [Anaerolineales bacterium]
MRSVFQPWAIFIVALKRMLSQYGLTLATLFGIVAATSLTMSIPLYADAVYHRLFRENVHIGGADEGEETAPRPPLEFLFAYEGSSYGVKQWEDIQTIDNYLSEQADSILQIPQRLSVRFLATDTFQLFPKVENGAMGAQDRLDWVSFATASDIRSHVLLLEGSVPDDLETTDSIVDVLISERMALEKGFQVGDTYVVLSQASSSDNAKTVVQLDVRIAGVWRAEQPEDRYWFFGPEFLEQRFLLLDETFREQISPEMPNEIYLAIWYMVLDDSGVRYQDIAQLIKRISVLEREAEVLMPGIQSTISPIQTLEAYHSNATRLAVQLYALNLPILSLIFAFIALTAGLSANQRRNEIAVLRSRGAQTSQIVGFVVLENIVLGVIGFLLSAPTSLAISYLIGQARHFLDFSSPSDLPLDQTGAALRIGLASIVLAIFLNVILSLSAAQGTVITYRQERSRMVQKPWWQRAWLDLLLLILVIFTIYLVRQQGTIDFYGGQSPMQNALFFLLPALIILSLTLFLLRLIPIVMGFIAKAAAWTPSLGLLMAARYLSRTPKFYNIPMLLLVLTLSLSAFFSSLAGTMDQHVHDLVYYRVGSDLRFLDRGENMNEGGLFSGFGTGGGIQQSESTDPRWVFLPISEHLELPDTQAAVRVGRYPVEIFWGENVQEGLFLGVDRFDFPGVAYWRQDFASASLGALMNKLALAQEGVLVPSIVMGQHGLDIGDALRFRVYTYGIETEMEMRVVGVFDLFPTWYPDQGPLLVGDL